MPINAKDNILFASAIAVASFAGWSVTRRSEPGPRPQYTAGTSDINDRVNSELIDSAEQKCLMAGRINGDAFKQKRKEILGDNESDVRVLCRQVKYQTDNVFTLQIKEKTGYTRDGKTYFPTGNIIPYTKK